MTEFKIKPVKEITITDLIQEDLQNFLYFCRISNVPNAIWVEGIILLIETSRMSEKIAERTFEGYRSYEKVVFVKYPKYTTTTKWNGGNYDLPLRNYMNIPRFRELAKWIKSQPIWQITPENMK